MRRLIAEALGSLLLAATVVGSGVMAQRLAGGNMAVALLANTGATVAVLAALIALIGPVSGAHFNPAVSLILALQHRLPWRESGAYMLLQVAGCCAGAVLAHAMFALPLIQYSTHARTGAAQWLAESVATFGLLLVVLGHRRAGGCSLDGGGMDRRGILVHCIDLIRQPSDHDRSRPHRYVFRHSSKRRPSLHRGTVRRRFCCSGDRSRVIPTGRRRTRDLGLASAVSRPWWCRRRLVSFTSPLDP